MPQRATHLEDTLAKASALSGERDVSEELDDPLDEVEPWRGMPPLPVGYRAGVNAQVLSHFLLKQAQTQSLLADVVSDGVQCLRIDRGNWSRSCQRHMAKWQRGSGVAHPT